MGWCERKLSKVEGFYFHGIANELLGVLKLDDRVIGAHVVEERQVVGLVVRVAGNIGSHLCIVDDLSVKLSLVGGHGAIEVHVVLCQSARLIKAGQLYHSSGNNLVLLNAEDRLLLELLYGVDNSEGHADGKGRRYGNQDDVDFAGGEPG